ncbi:hypothetical protein VPNG_00103 [Cytospora leucostoma]|uniref:Uncharacterized protein n=1 Tax=Cytospora leucostoma TaxID=1230097 RepID=A0A423XPG0_9PEZI|nr:hypothetical protein VPNG_00103 [Cytospora leucostoma]
MSIVGSPIASSWEDRAAARYVAKRGAKTKEQVLKVLPDLGEAGLLDILAVCPARVLVKITGC